MKTRINRIACMLALALSASAQAFAAAPAALSAQLQRKAATFFADDAPGGVVLVQRDGDVLLRRGYGLADVEHDVAMTPEMVFRLASVSKQFTAVAVLQFVQAGRLALDQAVGTLVPDLPKPLGEVTIRQLLTHTSGVPNISRIAESRAARRNEATSDELIAFFRDLPLDFEPGTGFAYSNSNYILLTRVIERISGSTYPQHMQHAVFEPLRMSRTRYGSHTALIADRAQGYQRIDGGLANADFISMSQPQGAGGLVSTIDDLARWDEALYSDRLLDPALLEEAFRRVKLADGSEPPYGFGWMIGHVQGAPSVEHGGYINGFNAYLLRVPAQRVFVAVLTNAEYLDPTDLATELAAIALERPYDKAPAAAAGDRWLGRYRFADGAERDVLQIGGRLHSQRVGADPIPLHATADGRYYLGEGLDYVTFANDGGIATMTMHQRLLGDSIGRMQ